MSKLYRLQGLPYWPAALTEAEAIAYTGVSEAQMREWRKHGIVRFLLKGRKGSAIALRSDLDEALNQMFAIAAHEDMDFGD
ncbi:hypothetical protein PX554_06550 [Sphingomonas sp. H39-1-10]|uniref:hypothetical protein n=1 Tax=Sphingomonas pollutisoli TaxID=3030829 RepID=UPI0023B89607|nr:hypothetical protein [Sphingomonas pollutisoli]MDF0487784.1 hypothetical protein [Sphingomonas pollutisoli]